MSGLTPWKTNEPRSSVKTARSLALTRTLARPRPGVSASRTRPLILPISDRRPTGIRRGIVYSNETMTRLRAPAPEGEPSSGETPRVVTTRISRSPGGASGAIVIST